MPVTWKELVVLVSQEMEKENRPIELLKLCHAYLRGVEINEPSGCKQIDRDTLARMINLYLNERHAVEHVSEDH